MQRSKKSRRVTLQKCHKPKKQQQTRRIRIQRAQIRNQTKRQLMQAKWLLTKLRTRKAQTRPLIQAKSLQMLRLLKWELNQTKKRLNRSQHHWRMSRESSKCICKKWASAPLSKTYSKFSNLISAFHSSRIIANSICYFSISSSSDSCQKL